MKSKEISAIEQELTPGLDTVLEHCYVVSSEEPPMPSILGEAILATSVLQNIQTIDLPELCGLSLPGPSKVVHLELPESSGQITENVAATVGETWKTWRRQAELTPKQKKLYSQLKKSERLLTALKKRNAAKSLFGKKQKLDVSGGSSVASNICKLELSDLATNNRGAVRSLAEDYAKTGGQGYYIYKIGEHTIFHLFDIPYFLKWIRNNFMEKDVVFDGKRAKWSDIKQLYEFDGTADAKVTTTHRSTSRLDALNVPYHTYALPEEKTIRAVIKGIPEGISAEEIKRELEVELPVISVTRFTSRTNKAALPVVLVQLSKNGGDKIYDLCRLLRLPGQQATDTAPRSSRPSPVVSRKSYAACAATNRPATTQPRQFRSPATGDMQSAGLINEVIGSFANLADELKKKTTRPKSLKIAFWNIAGLRSGRNEAELFANDHIDVLLLNETHLRACDNPKIRNYSLYRTDRDGAGGGTAIYIRSSLVHHEISATAANIEATAVVILTASGPLRLTAVYKSPNKALLDADLESLLVTGQPTIIAGDLNAKDPHTHNIAVYGPIEPTFFHTAGHRPDVLDILLAKDVTIPTEVTTANAGNSDHNPVIAHLSGEIKPHNLSSHKRICWPKFSHLMESTVTCSPPLKTPAELDQAVEQLSKCIHSALENSSRVITTPVGKNDVPPEIRELIRRKNQARCTWQRYADVNARTTMNQLARQVKTALQDHRNERWNETLEAINAENSNPQRMARALRKKRTIIPPIHTPNGIVHGDQTNPDDNNINMFNEPIPWKRSAKYLGVVLDSHLNWQDNTTRQYGDMLEKTSSTDSRQHKIYNYELRQMQRDLNTPTIKTHIKAISKKFYANPETHPNRSIREATRDYHEEDHMKYKRPKLILLEE
ncbi:hypothetical protein CBL_05095 [Carabus blaptoides fortunei]